MPHASELKEFGLEVESEEEEHHSLIELGSGHPRSRRTNKLLSPASSLKKRKVGAPCGGGSIARAFLRLGVLRWAALLVVLVVAVVYHVGMQSEETAQEVNASEDLEAKDAPAVIGQDFVGSVIADVGRGADPGIDVNSDGGEDSKDDEGGIEEDGRGDSGGEEKEQHPQLADEESASAGAGAAEKKDGTSAVPTDEDGDRGEIPDESQVENKNEVVADSSTSNEDDGAAPDQNQGGNAEGEGTLDESEPLDGGQPNSENEDGQETNDTNGKPQEETKKSGGEDGDVIDAQPKNEEGTQQKPAEGEGPSSTTPENESGNDAGDGTQSDGESKGDNDGGGADFGGKFTLERLTATRQAARSLIDNLNEYYFGETQARKMLLEPWLDNWDFDATPNNVGDDKNSSDYPVRQKKRRASKITDTIARALVTDDQKEFLIGTIGSSVAAGHDNCHYDSYESQLERTWGPVWEAAGMKFVHQNAGEGGGCGDDFRNQVFCIKQNVSPNIDIVHYSWTYFEHGDGESHRENLIRWTQMLKNQPPVHVFNTGKLPNKQQSTREYQLTDYYAEYGYNALYARAGLEIGGHDYDTERKNDIDRFGWGYVGDGYHNTTRYGEAEVDPARKKSLGVVMRNWHPGPLGFQFTADSFAYLYTTAMLKALDMIEADMRGGTDPRDIWSASKRRFHIKSSLPPPIFCDPMYCVVDEAPGCLNYEKPTFGTWGARVEDPDDDLNPHQGELQNWDVWQTPNDIWHMVGNIDKAVFQDRDDKEICRHLDACGGIRATSPENGMVVFRLPKMEVGLVVICGCCGKDVAEAMFMNNDKIEVKYNGEVLDRSTWDLGFPTKKCVRLLKKFPTMGAMAMTPTGHAYLSIRALEGLGDEVKISHVITL